MLARLLKFLTTAEQVGRDAAGNRYFKKPFVIDGVTREKRSVKFKGEVESTSLPVEWTSWLAGTRKQAPTEQELIDNEAYRRMVKMKVQCTEFLLEKEEEKRKFKAKTLQQEQVDMSPQSMERYMRQVSQQDMKDAKETEEDSKYSEPSGAGESFVPGTWRA